MFFITVAMESGQSFGEVMSRFGLDLARQNSTLRHQHNAHLTINGIPQTPVMRTVHSTHLIVPIDIRLSIFEYQPVINLQHGLRPRLVGAAGPPTLTHGLSIRITRNLGRGVGLNWIQTVHKLNDSDRSSPVDFVDAGHNEQPFYIQPPAGEAAPVESADVPCGRVATTPNNGVDFTATTTLAVLVDNRIILAAGKTWGFKIGTQTTLPLGVQVRPHRDATTADFVNQLRILRTGISQLRHSTGPNLNYLLAPTPNSILT